MEKQRYRSSFSLQLVFLIIIYVTIDKLNNKIFLCIARMEIIVIKIKPIIYSNNFNIFVLLLIFVLDKFIFTVKNTKIKDAKNNKIVSIIKVFIYIPKY